MRSRFLLCIPLAIALAAGALPGRSAAGGPSPERLTRSDGLSSNGVTALALDGGSLFVGTLAGLDRFQDGRMTRVETPLPAGRVTALLLDDGSVWAGTPSGLARRDAAGRWQSWTGAADGLTTPWVTSLAPGGFVGTYGGGVVRLREGAAGSGGNRFEPVGQDGPAWVTALAVDGEHVWAGSAGDALWHWNGSDWRRLEPPGDPGDSAVTALLIDKRAPEPAGGAPEQPAPIWVGTRAGLWHFEPPDRWTRSPLPAPVAALAYGGSDLFAAAGGSLYRLESNARWTRLVDRLPGAITALAANADEQWIGSLGGGLLHLGPPVARRPARLPVVLVHGYEDAPDVYRSQFHFLARWLQQDGWPVFYAEGLGPDDPLLDNAARLARATKEARAATGADRVLLIAHSFGGLIARAYIGSDLYQNDVAGLVTLGTPHAGVYLVYDFLARDLAAGDRRPATAELLPEHVATLERFLAGRGVPVLAIAGNRLPDGVLLAGLPPNDGLITAGSALAVPGATAVLRPLAHGWTPSLVASQVASYLFPDELYREAIRPWLTARALPPEDRRRAEASAPESDASALPAPPPRPGQTRQALVDRVLAPGETITVPLRLEANETVHLFLTWDRGTVAAHLIEPGGGRLEYDRPFVRDDVGYLELPATELRPLSLWSIRPPEAGRWLAVVTNSGEVTSRVRLDGIRPDGPQLNLSVSPPDTGGAAARVTATGLPGQTLVARLGDSEAVLRPDGSGRSSATLTLPPAPGYYPVEVSGAGMTRWAIVTRPDAGAKPSVRVERRSNGGVRVTASVESDGGGRYALGLEVWREGGELPAPGGTAEIRRLSAPRTLQPGLPVTVVWDFAADELPAGKGHIVARVTAFNAAGPLVPGQEASARE